MGVKKNINENKKRFVSVTFLGVFLCSVFILGMVTIQKIEASASDNVTGWAWNSNVGWLSFNCTNTDSCGGIDFGVSINETTGDFSGYAWNNSVGWVSFEVSDLSGCPGGTCTANISGANVSGWAKISSLGDGGWLSLNCSNTGGCGATSYGVIYNPISGKLGGWAWNETLGWFSFNSLNCDADEDGFSDGGVGCPVAGTAVSDYAVIYGGGVSINTSPDKPKVTGPTSGLKDANYEFGFVADDTTSWNRTSVTGYNASSRFFIHDSINNKYLLGGSDQTGAKAVAAIWESDDLDSWTRRTIDPGSTSNQYVYSMNYDAVNDRYVVLGIDVGWKGIWSSVGDVDSWVKHTSISDVGNFTSLKSIIYDVLNDKYVVTGNYYNGVDYDVSIWESDDLDSWTRHDVQTGLNNQRADLIYYDSSTDKKIIIGSVFNGVDSDAMIWESMGDLSSWISRVVDTSANSQQLYAIIHDTTNNKYVLAGCEYSEVPDSGNAVVWEASGLSGPWIKHYVSVDAGYQCLESMVYDQANNRYLVGGYHENKLTIWESEDLLMWTRHDVETSSGFHILHEVIYNSVDDEYVVGGHYVNGAGEDNLAVWRSSLYDNLRYGVDWDMSGGGTFTHVGYDSEDVSVNSVWGDGNFVYATKGASGLYVYSTNSVGEVVLLDSDNPGGTSMGVWGDGKFIYLVTIGGNLYSYNVNSLGTLTLVDSYIRSSNGFVSSVWGDGNFIYTGDDSGSRAVYSYSVDENGNFTQIDSHLGSGNIYDVWAGNGFVFAACAEYGLHSYTVDGTGNITHVDSHDPGTDWAIGVWGDGEFVYVAYRDAGLYVYSVDASGYLTLEDTHNPEPGSGGSDVWGDGRIIYLADGDDGVHSYSVDENGDLTYLDISDSGATWISGVWGDGTILYTANSVVSRGVNSYTVTDGVDEWVPSTGHVSAGTQASTTHLWNTVGSKWFRALAEDDGGLKSYWTLHNIVIGENDTPTAIITSPPGDNTYFVGTNINFAGQGFDTDGTVVATEWRDYGPISDVEGCDTPAPIGSGVGDLSSFSKNDLTVGVHHICFIAIDDLDSKTIEDEISVIKITITDTTECNDGIDNDGDTFVDVLDNGCWTDPGDSGTYDPADNSEFLQTQCNDGIDNDGDGYCDAIGGACTDGSTLGDAGCYDNFDPATGNPLPSSDSEETCRVSNPSIGKTSCDPGESFWTCPIDCFKAFRFIEF